MNGAGRQRSPHARAIALVLALLVLAALLGLGAWQVRRLAWKQDLIARVEARVAAPPGPAPGPPDWSGISADASEYRHVTLPGTFLRGCDTRVQALTALGAGDWILSPLRAPEGFAVLINRGFVPTDHAGSIAPPSGETRVTGLLRMSEPHGRFLMANDPPAGRWYSRDVAAIAETCGLGVVAPYFVDAEAMPGAGEVPVAGLTVIAFPNHHLVYALTWFSLAALLAAGLGWAIRDGRRRARTPGA